MFSEQGNLSFLLSHSQHGESVKSLHQEHGCRALWQSCHPLWPSFCPVVVLIPLFTVLAGAWGQPSREPCFPLAHVSVAVPVWGALWRDSPTKTSYPAGAAWGQAGCQAQPLSQHPCGQERPWGYVREQVWAVPRLPAPACTRPTSVS